ncbi:MAG: hypothetical protein ACK4U0_06450 [Mesorhizobium sp.]
MRYRELLNALLAVETSLATGGFDPSSVKLVRGEVADERPEGIANEQNDGNQSRLSA